jgi:hypothetical protein
MFALDLSPTGDFPSDSFDHSPVATSAASAAGGSALSQERFDSLRPSDHSPTAERFAPAWSELLHRAIAEPGLISDAYTRFHGYSLGNRFVALIQCEMRGLEPGPLNSFNGWRKLGYAIQEGEKALTLCMPLKGTLHREKTDSPGQKSTPHEDGHPDVEAVEYIRAFVWKPSWFVLSQTVPLGDNVAPLPTAAPLAWDGPKALATLDIKQVPFDLLDGNALGFARKREIAVSPLSPYQFKTLFHELAHVVLGHTTDNFRGEGNTGLDLSDGPQLSHALIEVEAESVALLLLATLDLPGQEFCRGYIQHWMGEGDSPAQDIPEKSAQRIFGAADRILCAGVGDTRSRTPTAEEVGLNGSLPALPAPSSHGDAFPMVEAGLPPPELAAPAPSSSESSTPESSSPELSGASFGIALSAPQRPVVGQAASGQGLSADAATLSRSETPTTLPGAWVTAMRAPATGEKAATIPDDSTPISTSPSDAAPSRVALPTETDAWALYGHLQQVHSELHPEQSERGVSFANALRHVQGRDPGAAKEVQHLVKSASRQLKTAFELMEVVLDGKELPSAEEADPFEDMAPGEVRHSEVRRGEVPGGEVRPTSPVANPESALTGAEVSEDSAALSPAPLSSNSLSPTRQAAARRAVGRTLRSELEAEKGRFNAAAKRHELPTGRGSEKAMLAAIAAYLELPIASRRDLSSHQWARCASAIETEDLRW